MFLLMSAEELFWESSAGSFRLAEAGQMRQSIYKNQRNLKDIDIRFTEIYRGFETHGSILRRS